MKYYGCPIPTSRRIRHGQQLRRVVLSVYFYKTTSLSLSRGGRPLPHAPATRNRSRAALNARAFVANDERKSRWETWSYCISHNTRTFVANAKHRSGRTAMFENLSLIASRNASVMGTDLPSGIITCSWQQQQKRDNRRKTSRALIDCWPCRV